MRLAYFSESRSIERAQLTAPSADLEWGDVGLAIRTVFSPETRKFLVFWQCRDVGIGKRGRSGSSNRNPKRSIGTGPEMGSSSVSRR